MSKNTKIIIGLIILAAIVGGYYLQKNRSAQVSGEAIKIGAIYTFTGDGADIGEELKKGTDIAVEEINNKEGIHGRKIEVIYEDAPNAAARPTVEAAQKLISINNVKMILDYPYSGLGSIRTFAEQYKVPIIDVIDSSDEIASFGDWVFSTGIYADGVGKLVAEFAKQELGVNKAAILTGKDDYLFAVSGGFQKTFENLGGKITTREEFLVGTADLRTQLLKIKNTDAQAIFVAHLGEGGTIVKQATELGFRGVFLGSDTFSLADVQRRAGSLLNNRTYFSLWRNNSKKLCQDTSRKIICIISLVYKRHFQRNISCCIVIAKACRFRLFKAWRFTYS